MVKEEINLKDDFFTDMTTFIAEFRGYRDEVKNYNKEGDAARVALETLTGIASDVDLTEENIGIAFDTRYEKTLEKIAETEIFLNSLKMPISDSANVADTLRAYRIIGRTIANKEGLHATLKDLTTYFVDEFKAIGDNYKDTDEKIVDGSTGPEPVRDHLENLNDAYETIKDKKKSIGEDAVKLTLTYIRKNIDRLKRKAEVDELTEYFSDSKDSKWVKEEIRSSLELGL